MTATTSMPAFRELSEAECDEILERNHVGRLAFAHGNRIGIVPVHYVRVGDWIYGRTAEGEKLSVMRHNWWVAFETDEVDGMFTWRSVVVHGGFYTLDPDGGTAERQAWREAVDALRTLISETFREGDPVPSRTVVFRIAVQEVSGREAREEG